MANISFTQNILTSSLQIPYYNESYRAAFEDYRQFMMRERNRNINLGFITNYKHKQAPLQVLRLLTLVILVVMLTLHIRSLRVFRWEQWVTGGILVTYSVAMVGLSLCAGMADCGGAAFQAYLCCSGSALFALNAVIIWRRWRNGGEMMQMMSELFILLGVRLRRQILLKVWLSIITSAAMLADLVFTPIIMPQINSQELKNLYPIKYAES